MRAALLISAALLLATPAFAQDDGNNQYNSGDTNAETEIEIGTAEDVGATAVAGGNVANSESEGDFEIESTQHNDGDTNADADVTAWTVHGNIAVTSAAVANGGTVVAGNGDVEIDATQLSHGNTSANVRFRGGHAHNAGTSASAAGNVGAVSMQNGQLRALTTQEATGAYTANVEADHDQVLGQVVSGAVASANNLSLAGETATVLTDTQQRASGHVGARVDLYAGQAGDASGNATANANSIAIDNQYGYVNARIRQEASSSVAAQSYVTLGGEFSGFASAGAYGVGNSAIVSNSASDTVIDVAQLNTGGVSSEAALVAGGGDGQALASSAAYGNTATGVVCGYCDEGTPGMYADVNQVNTGDVTSRATVSTGRAGLVATTATAIGNAATFSTQGQPN